MSLRCTFCRKEFSELPADAVKVGNRRGVTQIYKFSDGSVHNLMSTKVDRSKAAKTAKEEKQK
jgi:protein-disulfide isomerase